MPFNKSAIPDPVIRRLSLYLRELVSLADHGHNTISSKTIAQSLDITDAQVRKDLAYFGQFGQPGVGYRIPELVTHMRSILGTDRIWNVALVGAGNLGHALGAYHGFLAKGFRLVAVFDSDPDKIGQTIAVDGSESRLEIHPIDRVSELTGTLSIQMAMLAVPASVAQTVAETVYQAGIRGILNFAPVALHMPQDAYVVGVDLAMQLEQLSFRLNTRQDISIGTEHQSSHPPPDENP